MVVTLLENFPEFLGRLTLLPGKTPIGEGLPCKDEDRGLRKRGEEPDTVLWHLEHVVLPCMGEAAIPLREVLK